MTIGSGGMALEGGDSILTTVSVGKFDTTNMFTALADSGYILFTVTSTLTQTTSLYYGYRRLIQGQHEIRNTTDRKIINYGIYPQIGAQIFTYTLSNCSYVSKVIPSVSTSYTKYKMKLQLFAYPNNTEGYRALSYIYKNGNTYEDTIIEISIEGVITSGVLTIDTTALQNAINGLVLWETSSYTNFMLLPVDLILE